MLSLRKWVTFVVLTMGIFSGTVAQANPNFYGPAMGPNHRHPVYVPRPVVVPRPPMGRPIVVTPPPVVRPPVIVAPPVVVARPPVVMAPPIAVARPPIVVTPGIPIARPIPAPIVAVGPNPAVMARRLMQDMEMHAWNLTHEIGAVNGVMRTRNFPFVLNPEVVTGMMAEDPYIYAMVLTTLTRTPPRPPRAPDFSPPAWRPQQIEYMVAWRAADVYFAAQDWLAFSLLRPAPELISILANRFTVMRANVLFYIEAMRRTYLINNAVGKWPIAGLLETLQRMEAQLAVMSQLMDAIYCNPVLRPFFPPGWGAIDAAFGGFRLAVAAPGPLPIAAMPFYPEGFNGLGMLQPNMENMEMTPRQGAGPVPEAYNPNLWTGAGPNSPLYTQNVPPLDVGMNAPGHGAFPAVDVPGNLAPSVGVGLPAQAGPGVAGGGPAAGGGPGGPGAAGVPNAGAPGYDQNYGLENGAVDPSAQQLEGQPQAAAGQPPVGAAGQVPPTRPVGNPNAQAGGNPAQAGASGAVWGNFGGADPAQTQQPAQQQ